MTIHFIAPPKTANDSDAAKCRKISSDKQIIEINIRCSNSNLYWFSSEVQEYKIHNYIYNSQLLNLSLNLT